MLTTLAIILIGLWALGLGTDYIIGGFIHIFLALGILALLFRIIRGRNPIS